VIYPVLKGKAALSGEISFGRPKKLTIEFNCLGVGVKTRMFLNIDIPLKSRITLVIDKECSQSTLVGHLADKVVTHGKAYGALKISLLCLFICGIAYVVITCINLYEGKSLRQAVPCGGCIFNICLGYAKVEKNEVNTSQSNVTEITVLSFFLMSRNYHTTLC